MPVVCRAFHDVRRINFFSEAGGVYFAVKLNSHENKKHNPGKPFSSNHELG